jgi:hypothetical protein
MALHDIQPAIDYLIEELTKRAQTVLHPGEHLCHDDNPANCVERIELVCIWQIWRHIEWLKDRVDDMADQLDTANDWLETIAENTEAP